MFLNIFVLLLPIVYSLGADENEYKYSPSKWAIRENARHYHVDYVNNASILARNTIPNELNIAYGKSDRQKYDLFGTDLPAESEIYFFIHGGYWQLLDKENYDYVATPLHKKGMKTIVVEYDLCPNVTIADIIKEIRQAFLHVLDYAQSKGSKGIHVSGHSAGAHLAASLFTDSFFVSLNKEERDLLKQVFLISGAYDLVPIVKEKRNDALKLNNSTARESSPFWKRLDNSDANIQFYVIAGGHDPSGIRQQTIDFDEKLRGLGWNSTYVFLKDVDHFTIMEDFLKPDYELLSLIKQFNSSN